MRLQESSIPQPDPYFDAPAEAKSKPAARLSFGKDEHVRNELLREESIFQLAGRTGMVLGALVFVTFAIPVAAMLRHADEPDGILLADPSIQTRWMARMTTDFSVAIVGTFMSWGLARRKRWARAVWTVVSIAPAIMIVLIIRAEASETMAGLLCVSAILLASQGLVIRRLWSRPGKILFSDGYADVIARTPHLKPLFKAAFWPGLRLAMAMLVLCWSLTFLVLSTLVRFQVIHSV